MWRWGWRRGSGLAAYRRRVRLKFLLRPGWLGLIALVVVFASLCFTLLAPWQFSRSDEAQARNNAISESFHASPKPLAEVLPIGQVPDQRTEWSQVVMHGRYLAEGETLAWQRTVLGEPAFEVLTPFRLDDGTTVLVDRGFIRPVNGTQAPDYAAAPAGDLTLTARVRTDEQDSKQRPMFDHDGHRWAYAVNAETIANGTGIALRPGYLALNEGQPGVLEPLPLPRLESGPYFSYALQWIAFGIMAIIAIGYLVYSELRTDARPAWRNRTDADSTADEPADGPAPGGRGKRSGRRKVSVAEAIAEEERREREEAAARESGETAGETATTSGEAPKTESTRQA
ncbi:cytochrome oxidase assembly protein ShyY1 [Saccharopolyspora spinosa]|uniref:SURF1-like protein n=1 Tax=Saccharopolyspora spinosa TaxID=60894 RepID=A0A2N3XWP8_SACSN|nr:SURF1 family cytochrome oxidase biogenesis protein [Saccharopolyspora spinosa]PKW15082.1 cytochrome oxidase assembly protein ShyY1 [Saccharopolyspora spinosa]